MLHIGANQGNNNQIVLKWSLYNLFPNKIAGLKIQCEFGGIKGIPHVTNGRKVCMILHIGADQSNNSKTILKWLRCYIFCNYLQHKKI